MKTWRPHRQLALGAIAALNLASTPLAARADVIDDWNQALLETFRNTSGGPGFMARSAAMTHGAVFDALNSVRRSHSPVFTMVEPVRPVNRGAAAAQAAHDVLVSLYPARRESYDALLNQHLSAIPNVPGKANGISVGRRVAAAVVAARQNDHSDDATPYTYGTRPGDYIITDPAAATRPVAPNWGKVRPFVMSTGSQFRPEGPGGFKHPLPLLASAFYADQLNEVKSLGARNSVTRTSEQTDIARFWSNDAPGTYHPPGHLLQVTQEIIEQQGGLAPADKARVFALVSVAMADAGIAVWERKYQTDLDLWRPVTAIQNADLDGNRLTQRDPSWQPLLEFTPAFPSYPSGHAAFGMAHATILQKFYGTDSIAFSATSEDPKYTGRARTFSKLSDAARENGLSRIYLGVHYRMDIDAGFSVGSTVAAYVWNHMAHPLCPGDMNGDGVVNARDMAEYTTYYFASDGRADMNKDGVVNSLDFYMFVDAYLGACKAGA